MINEKFVLVAAVVNALGTGTYAYETIRGKTKPNRVTWFLWGVIPMIAFAAQIKTGVTWAAVLTFTAAFFPLIVFAVSFLSRGAYWQLSVFDKFCGVVAIAAVGIWLVTGKGLFALLLSIFADFCAGLPTIIKAYRNPETEHPTAYLSGTIAATITLLTIQEWRFENYAFALYIFTVCVLLYVLVRFKLGRRFGKLGMPK